MTSNPQRESRFKRVSDELEAYSPHGFDFRQQVLGNVWHNQESRSPRQIWRVKEDENLYRMQPSFFEGVAMRVGAVSSIAGTPFELAADVTLWAIAKVSWSYDSVPVASIFGDYIQYYKTGDFIAQDYYLAQAADGDFPPELLLPNAPNLWTGPPPVTQDYWIVFIGSTDAEGNISEVSANYANVSVRDEFQVQQIT